MANIINAITSGAGGLSTTADASGIINLQSGGTTVAAVSSTGLAVTGTLSSTGTLSQNGTSVVAVAPGTNGNLLTSNGTIWTSAAPAASGKVLQVVSTIKSDTFSAASSGSWVDITGMSVSITPSSSSNKILIIVNGNVGAAAGTSGWNVKLLRNSTDIDVGDAATSRYQTSTAGANPDNNYPNTFGISFLDSPATTSAITYKIQGMAPSSSVYFNRSNADGTNSSRAASTITVMEIKV
jgi:hypothetical protein